MQTYQSHKRVKAAKITAATRLAPESDHDANCPFDVMLEGHDANPVRLPAEMCIRHAPMAGDYLVEYADGYRSISPGNAFEEGYVAIQEGQATYAELFEAAAMLSASLEEARAENEVLQSELAALQANPDPKPTAQLYGRSTMAEILRGLHVSDGDIQIILGKVGAAEDTMENWRAGIASTMASLSYDLSARQRRWLDTGVLS